MGIMIFEMEWHRWNATTANIDPIPCLPLIQISLWMNVQLNSPTLVRQTVERDVVRTILRPNLEASSERGGHVEVTQIDIMSI